MKRKRYLAAGAALLILALVCAGIAWKEYREQQTAGETYEKLQETAKETPQPEPPQRSRTADRRLRQRNRLRFPWILNL